MNLENTKRLYESFPRLFRGFEDKGSLMAMDGFQVRDGWYQLIFELCLAVEARAHVLRVPMHSDAWPLATQVKQKFGLLRFSLTAPADLDDSRSIQMIAREAEEKSGTICEICGEPGERRTQGYIQTLCDFHEIEYINYLLNVDY